MVPNTTTHKTVPLFASMLIKAWLTTNISKDQTDCIAVKRAKWLLHLSQVNQTDPERIAWNRTKGWKNGFFCVNDENSQINICSYCISKTYCHLGFKNGGHSPIGCTRPQNNMFEKEKKTSTQRTLQQSNTTHCMLFTTWTAHKWCLPSQTMISIPGLMWRPLGTIKRLAREMHTRKYRALYEG